MKVDHACPVAWAFEHGLLAGSPVERSWCLSSWRDTVAALAEPDAAARQLLLWRQDRLALYYAPWDWVNRAAKVMLVGITPGAHQATEALREAQRCLRAGCSNQETLRQVDAAASFSGPMRTNLVTMLDGIGLHSAVGIVSTARLFDKAHHLAARVSAIDYPIFVDGKNYGGGNPRIDRDPTLRSLVIASLGARVTMAPEALVIPLGTAAQSATNLLIAEGLLGPHRCLQGFPHPSGLNGWRLRHYNARRGRLTEDVARWAVAVQEHADEARGACSPAATPAPSQRDL